MYPYEANRADELTIQPGDVISVLYIDNENWWMGELADGRQGYFPSNYAMEQGKVCLFKNVTCATLERERPCSLSIGYLWIFSTFQLLGLVYTSCYSRI